MIGNLLKPITKEQIEQYEKDGVVCVRGHFNRDWTSRMLAAGVRHMVTPSGNRRVQDDDQGSGRFVTGTHMSRYNEEFMDFALNSPAADIAAKMMRLDQVRFFYDQLFIKEPGTQAPTAWHHDLPFWPFDGNRIASVWIACTPVSTETSGLVYVAGSHKWNKMYRPVPAVPIEDFMSEEVKRFEECPMFHKEFNNPEYKFLSWEMEVGDALVHHPLTVHGSGKNSSSSQRRVALSLRYFGGDAVWHGPRTRFAVPGTEDESIFELGKMPINNDIFPIVTETQ